MEPSGLNLQPNPTVKKRGDGAPNIGWQNPAHTAGMSPISRPISLSGCSTAMVNAALPGSSMSGAAEQDAQLIGRGSVPVHPAMPSGVSGDSEDAASIQFAPSGFLPRRSARLSRDPEHPSKHFQPNVTGIQAEDSQRSSSSKSAVISDSHSKLKSDFPANTQGQHATEPTSLVADHNMHKYQRPQKKLKTLSQLNDPTVLSTLAAFKERTITQIYMQNSGSAKTEETLRNEETPARKAKPRRKRHRAKVIREDHMQGKKQDPAVTSPEVKSPSQKPKRSYVRKKRNLSSLEKCSGPVSDQSISGGGAENAATSRAASVQRRLQFEIGFDMLSFCQAGGVKKKRSVRVCGNSFLPIMDIEKNNAQLLTRCMEALYDRSYLKFVTKKRSQREHLQSRSSIQLNMDKENMFSSGKPFSGGSKGLDGKLFKQTSLLEYTNFLQRVTSSLGYVNLHTEHVHTNEMHPSLTTSIVVSSGATGGLLNSLVPFGGQMIFPCERPLHLVKEQRSRAKVDLDFETTRVWNLLMGKAAEPLDGTDVDKHRWWHQERQVFRGRANSFIERMGLIQGDRRFSSWKGSVVDSVVGVFLTQNVSDHVSSSAYMALAASFPPGSVNNNCKDDIASQDNEDIISTSAVVGISMFDFFDNSPRPDLVELFEDLSITYEKIHVETKSNGTTGKKLPLFMPSDNHTAQKTVISTQNSPETSTALPVELHCNKSSRFEASDFQEHESLSATGEMISETANRLNAFTSKSGLDKAAQVSRQKKIRTTNKKNTENIDWDKFRRQACENGQMKEIISERRDAVDWEAVRCADVHMISHVIQERGMNNVLAERIQSFLNRLVRDHGSIDLEWLRAIPLDSAKDYLLSIRGLGLKSVECVRLLTLHQLAFPDLCVCEDLTWKQGRQGLYAPICTLLQANCPDHASRQQLSKSQIQQGQQFHK